MTTIADTPTGPRDFKVDWLRNFTPEVGLWRRQGAGHTRAVASLESVHPGRESAARLLAAATLGQIHQVDAFRVLLALRAMQVLDGSGNHGVMRWYWEEDRPYDHNATFFTAANLIPLERCFARDLPADASRVLRDILIDMRPAFASRLAHNPFHYPNACIGDIAAAWLLSEISQEPADRRGPLIDAMVAAADALTKSGWGWGEHLSDIYRDVSLEGLSMLLCLSRELPEPVASRYRALMGSLLAIDERLGGGPTVPAVRSYAFLEPPGRSRCYRDTIRPLSELPTTAEPDMSTLKCALFHRLGWHAIAPPAESPATELRVPCFGGVVAIAHCEPDFRIGSLSRFPLMPRAEDLTWGLSWQSMPVAFLTKDKGWAYLQWQAVEEDRSRCHPAESFGGGYLGNALSRAVRPPVVGYTHCLQRGGDVLALRIMPVVPGTWQSLTDRLRMINHRGKAEEKSSPAGSPGAPSPHDSAGLPRWSQLHIQAGEREIGIQCVPLCEPVGKCELARPVEGRLDWGITLDQPALRGLTMIATLWGFSPRGLVTSPPHIRKLPAGDQHRRPEEAAWQIEWDWPDRRWVVRVDPLSDRPLVEAE